MNKLLERMVNWVLIHVYDEDDYEHIVLEQAHCSQCGQHRDLVNGRCVTGC